MKIKKSIIACAVVMAFGAQTTAFAANDNKTTDVQINKDFMANASGNVLNLSQTSQAGAVVGNDVSLMQEGDTNGIDASVDGDGNETSITQIGLDNVTVSASTGDSNSQSINQDGEGE